MNSTHFAKKQLSTYLLHVALLIACCFAGTVIHVIDVWCPRHNPTYAMLAMKPKIMHELCHTDLGQVCLV